VLGGNTPLVVREYQRMQQAVEHQVLRHVQLEPVLRHHQALDQAAQVLQAACPATGFFPTRWIRLVSAVLEPYRSAARWQQWRLARAGKTLWLEHAAWQDLRRLVERLMVTKDWFELYVAQNLVLDGLLHP